MHKPSLTGLFSRVDEIQLTHLKFCTHVDEHLVNNVWTNNFITSYCFWMIPNMLEYTFFWDTRYYTVGRERAINNSWPYLEILHGLVELQMSCGGRWCHLLVRRHGATCGARVVIGWWSGGYGRRREGGILTTISLALLTGALAGLPLLQRGGFGRSSHDLLLTHQSDVEPDDSDGRLFSTGPRENQ